jgi:flavin-dependent dehydrogenase
MYDIAIIGAGPAGSTLARLLPSRYRVLLVDRRELGLSPADVRLRKPCGGLLAPAAQHELARQGLGVPRRVLSGPALFAVRSVDRATGLERLYQRFYVNVDRELFDRWLVSLVPSRVDARFGWRLAALEADGDASFLTFATPSGSRTCATARLVVGADGAASLVRRLAYPDAPPPTRYVAVQGEYHATGGDPHYGVIFDPRVTDFYGWTVPKGDTCLAGLAVGAGHADSALAAHGELVRFARDAGFGLGEEVSRASAPIVRPTALGEVRIGRDGALLAGEAAGFISPSSAEGISYALSSAAALASAIEPGVADAATRYRAAALPLVLNVTAKQVKSAAIHTPRVRRAIMRSGVGAIREGAPGRRGAALSSLAQGPA